MTTTEPTATIICTKSQFRAALSHEFAVAMATATEASMDDVREAIEALAQRADNTRGVFSGYDDYLDLAYTVAPDAKRWPTDAEITANHKALDTADSPDALKIPAVTDEQRAQAREAADASLREAIRGLNGAAAMLREHANDPEMIEALSRDVWQLANVLTAAAGHLRIAQQ